MKYFLLPLIAFISIKTEAQLPDYYVYYVKGDVTLTKPGKAPVIIRQKDLVFKNDIITVKKGMSLTLVDKDASFLVLSTPVACRGSELTGKANKKTNDGVTAKYFHLMYDELLNPNKDFEKFKKDNIAGVKAGVSRGDKCNNRLLPMEGYKTSAPTILFRWRKTNPTGSYRFEIYDQQNQLSAEMIVKDTFLILNTAETLKGKPGTYKWRVASDGNNCEDEMPIYFEILSDGDEQRLVSQVLLSTTDDNLEHRLQQIDKLEKNGLINAVSARYKELVKSDPSDRALRKSYVAFLLNYGFDEEARAVWK